MKKIISLAGIFLCAFAAQSCEDNFLNVQPKTEIGGENFFNSADDLQMYLNSLINWPGYGGMFLEASDDATTTGSAEYRNIMTNDVTSRQITSGWNWDRLRDINYFLANFEKADISEADLRHFEGVARFHRARFYMDKVKRFGDVPWYDKVLETDDEDLYKARDSREFVIDKIFEDYQFAAEHVRPASGTGDVNNWVVRTFMARHALHEGTFRKYHDYLNLPHASFLEIARDQAQEIMNSGLFDIHSTGNPNDDYRELFISTDLTSNSEIILVSRGIEGEVNSGWGTHSFGAYEQSPTKDLLQSYLMEDGSFYSEQPDYETNSFVEEFENRDPRLSQTYTYPGWVVNNTSTHAVGTDGEPYVQELSPHFTGYHLLKWFVNDSDNVYQANMDLPVLRYAEVILIFAEARAELGELTQSDLDNSINLLRARAGMPDMTMNPQVDPVQQGRYPNVTSSEVLEIRRERRVELTHEGRRFDDLMRYGAGEVLETLPKGLYFPGTGNYDLTGDGNDDIKLILNSETIPSADDREVNNLGETLIYYRVGSYTSNAGVRLEGGTEGSIIARDDMGVFESPKHYYRPVPERDTQINTNLEQIYGWE
ncbi:MAG: RagB/SusD family nutrient uptake outer membrane protein [Balneolales bacterium]